MLERKHFITLNIIAIVQLLFAERAILIQTHLFVQKRLLSKKLFFSHSFVYFTTLSLWIFKTANLCYHHYIRHHKWILKLTNVSSDFVRNCRFEVVSAFTRIMMQNIIYFCVSIHKYSKCTCLTFTRWKLMMRSLFHHFFRVVGERYQVKVGTRVHGG